MNNEIIKILLNSKDDILYFIDTLLKVELSAEQRTQLVHIKRNKYVFHNTNYEIDKELTAIYLLWKLIFSKNESISLLGKMPENRFIFKRIKELYESIHNQYVFSDFRFGFNRISAGGNVIFSGSTNKYSVVGKSIDCIFILSNKSIDYNGLLEYALPALSATKNGQIIISGIELINNGKDIITNIMNKTENFRFVTVK